MELVYNEEAISRGRNLVIRYSIDATSVDDLWDNGFEKMTAFLFVGSKFSIDLTEMLAKNGHLERVWKEQDWGQIYSETKSAQCECESTENEAA